MIKNRCRPSLAYGLLLATCLALASAAPARGAAEEGDKPEESFSVVLLPDTQLYSQKYPDTYVAQTLWIRKRLKEDNLKFAIHLGDIVQNVGEEPEWKNAHRAMEILDGVIPYSMVPGNHDLSLKDRDSTLYNKYFSPKRFADQPWYGGHKDETNDNNYCYFTGCGVKFLVISLEFAPRDETLEWATEVAAKHPEHKVIVATHCYLRRKDRDTSCATSYKVDGNSGEQIWQKFVRKSPNVALVVCGHIAGTGLQTSVNDAGGKVVEMLTDYQGLPHGGDGWLRTLKFVPAEKKLYVTTYSPLLDKQNEAPHETFSIDFELPVLEPAK